MGIVLASDIYHNFLASFEGWTPAHTTLLATTSTAKIATAYA